MFYDRSSEKARHYSFSRLSTEITRASFPPQAINGCDAIGLLSATRHIVDHKTRKMKAHHSQILLFLITGFVSEVDIR
ncbi:hypothetical protein SISSUDRAFT_1064128 [Sistotremastrum suecicum HHB10207 ss-3]|uniref:Uncharacterized protein n=1 Tax=Sistotremastrum suecicum HHB10207 ss-3 TaxID=1314776 RepID=A0A166AZQ5_9AGAM|nr:hypothetical protein SISSUDRAFT_1064128 [Sistotremastrum suecicum HHB10207 ss-3]